MFGSVEQIKVAMITAGYQAELDGFKPIPSEQFEVKYRARFRKILYA
jgi:hypothetical protein